MVDGAAAHRHLDHLEFFSGQLDAELEHAKSLTADLGPYAVAREGDDAVRLWRAHG